MPLEEFNKTRKILAPAGGAQAGVLVQSCCFALICSLLESLSRPCESYSRQEIVGFWRFFLQPGALITFRPKRCPSICSKKATIFELRANCREIRNQLPGGAQIARMRAKGENSNSSSRQNYAYI
jgi:hypothetical protein